MTALIQRRFALARGANRAALSKRMLLSQQMTAGTSNHNADNRAYVNPGRFASGVITDWR